MYSDFLNKQNVAFGDGLPNQGGGAAMRQSCSAELGPSATSYQEKKGGDPPGRGFGTRPSYKAVSTSMEGAKKGRLLHAFSRAEAHS